MTRGGLVRRVAIAVTLVAVPPALLIWLLVAHRLTVGDVPRRAVEQPLSSAMLMVAAATGAVVLWCVIAVGIIVEIRSRATGRRWLRRLRLPTPLQTAASGLLGAYLVATAAAPANQGPSETTASPQPDDEPHPDGSHTAATVDASTSAANPSPAGIDLADGSWLPPPVTDAVTSAAAAIWWRRRRHYQPDPRGTTRHLGLDPLPMTVAAIQTLTTAEDTTVVTAATQPDHLVVPADLPPGGIALTGDGAIAAARGLLVTLVLARPQPNTATGTVVLTTTATLDLILPTRPRSVAVPGVREVGTVTDVVAVLDAAGQAPPTVLTVADNVHEQQRLADTVAATGTTAVVLGGWAYGDVAWHVDPAGYVNPWAAPGSPQRRLCVLTPRAATDLLHLVQIAAAEPPERSPGKPTGTIAVGGVPQLTSARSPTRLLTLGPPALQHAGVDITVRRSAAWQVLIYLAIHPAGATSHQLATAIWPAEHPHATTGRLYTTISVLRRTLTDAGADPTIDHDGDHYQLHPSLDVDLWHLERAAATALHARTEHARQDACTAVITHYRGELAAGRRWPWLAPHVERVRRTVIDAYVDLAAHTDPPTAARLLEQASRIDPLNDYLWTTSPTKHDVDGLEDGS